jgi:hypothetical protein
MERLEHPLTVPRPPDIPLAPRELVSSCGTRTEVRIHQANVPDCFRGPEDQARFKASLDRFAAYLETLVS